MAGISIVDLFTIAFRLLLILLLYFFVFAVLQALRRDVLGAGSSGPGRQRGAHDAPPRPAHASLTLLESSPDDGPIGRVVPITGTIVLGRRSSCDVALHDDAVSAAHARIRHQLGAWQVEDLNSTNGTFRNGRRVVGAAALYPGDVVTMGLESWRFDAPAAGE